MAPGPKAPGLPPRLVITPLRGYLSQADRLAELLTDVDGVTEAGIGSLEQALAAAGRHPGDYTGKISVRLEPQQPAAAAVATVLTSLLDTLEANVPGTIRDIDTEFLHDLRIAVRRTRSALKLAGDVLPAGLAARFRPEFKWLGDLTTPTRDMDVYLLGFGGMAAGLVAASSADLEPFRAHLARKRAAEQRQLARGLRNPKFSRLSRDWREALAAVPASRRARPTARTLADQRIRKAHRRVLADGAAITPASAPEALHDLRKRAKELRYALEIFGSLYDPGAHWQAIRELKALQDCLGAVPGHPGADGRAARVRRRDDGRADRARRDAAGHGRGRGRPGPPAARRAQRVRRPFPRLRRARRAEPDPGPDRGGPRMKIFATYNIKGGVGKTATAVNLAHLAAKAGHRVLLWDLDPQAAATFLFRIRPRVKGGGKALIQGTRTLDAAIKGTDFDRLDLLPADFTYRNLDLLLDSARKPERKLGRLLAPLRSGYDVVFLDCPPSISLLSESVLHAADVLLVPLIPTTLSVRTLDQLTEFIDGFEGKQPGILAFFSMIDRRKRLHKEIAATLPAQRKDVASTAIPALSIIEQMSVQRAPVTAFAPRSAAARSYVDLWQEAADRAGLAAD